MDANDQGAPNDGDAANSGGKPPKEPKIVEIVVNEQKVKIPKGKHSGLEIKQVAIGQGAALEVDFVLSVQHGDHHVTVADDEVVSVHAGMDFLAVAGDDNS